MLNLKHYIDELEVNYNDLLAIYREGRNTSGKTESQLLYQEPNHFSFKKAVLENKDTKLLPKLFKLRKNFNDLLQNHVVTSCIAKIIFYNPYNVSNHGHERIQNHLLCQVRKIEFALEDDSTEFLSEIHLVRANAKGVLSKDFFILLREININGDLIFKNEIEDSEQFRVKITSFMQNKFPQITSPISFEVGEGAQYIAYYIITVLYRLIAPSDDFNSLKQVIKLNGKNFSPSSRNSSWSKQIKPRVKNEIVDPVFIDVATQLDAVVRSIHS